MEVKELLEFNQSLTKRWARGETLFWLPSNPLETITDGKEPLKAEEEKQIIYSKIMTLIEECEELEKLARETKESLQLFLKEEGRVDKGTRYEFYIKARKFMQNGKHYFQKLRNDTLEYFKKEQKSQK